MKFDVILIGAGPAGIFCAIEAAERGAKVCVLEKNDAPGKKLLIAGSGRCNLTHSGDIKDFFSHYGEKDRFVKPALMNFTNEKLTEFFAALDLELKEMNDGKIFPVTEKGADVLRVLIEKCNALGVTIQYGSPVKLVEKSPKGFTVETDNGTYKSKKLVVATGGRSYPATGNG